MYLSIVLSKSIQDFYLLMYILVLFIHITLLLCRLPHRGVEQEGFF